MIAKSQGFCGGMLRRRDGITCTLVASFTVRIKKIPFAGQKCPLDLTTKYRKEPTPLQTKDSAVTVDKKPAVSDDLGESKFVHGVMVKKA